MGDFVLVGMVCGWGSLGLRTPCPLIETGGTLGGLRPRGCGLRLGEFGASHLAPLIGTGNALGGAYTLREVCSAIELNWGYAA